MNVKTLDRQFKEHTAERNIEVMSFADKQSVNMMQKHSSTSLAGIRN